jgi:biopolymer transport protein TolR
MAMATGGFRDINVTPMVDVMLVLLIIFMVTAPLLTTGMHVDLPRVQASNVPTKDSHLVLSITRSERVMLGDRDITGRVLKALMEDDAVQRQKELYIEADKDVRYSVVAKVVAAVQAANITSLNLVVDPVEESP